MKLFKTVSLSLVLATALLNSTGMQAALTPYVYNETPAKTVVIKNPMAADANKFFAAGTIFNFEVFQAGSSAEVSKIMTALGSDPAVESVNEGPLVGEYRGFTLVLKSAQNKEWFISEFRRAGLNTIKINNNPIVAVEKI